MKEIKMDYQEKILYMGLMVIIKILIKMIPQERYFEVYDDHIQKTILDMGLLIDQRINEIKERE